STAGGVGPVYARAWIRHLIEEADETASARVLHGRPGQPGGAWCVHSHLQGTCPEQRRRQKRLGRDLHWRFFRPPPPSSTGRTPLLHRSQPQRKGSKSPLSSKQSP